MGKVGAAMGMGMVLGPGIGGWLASRSLPLPFFVASALSVVALLLVAIVLPESLPAELRSKQPLGAQGPRLSMMWKALAGRIGFLFLLAFLLSFGLTNFEGVFGLYALERFGYGPHRWGRY